MPKSRGRIRRSGKNDFRIPHTITRNDYFRDGTDEWFREAIYTCVRGLRGLLGCREVFAERLGLTPSQFAVLMGIAYRQGGEGVSIGEVARHVALGPTHVTTEIGRLIAAGFVVKRPNPDDGRSVLVSLTQKGESAVLTVTPLVREVNDALFHGVDAASVQSLAQTMKTISANCDRVMAGVGWRMKHSPPSSLEHPETKARTSSAASRPLGKIRRAQ